MSGRGIAAVVTTFALVVTTLVLTRAAHRVHSRWLRAESRAERYLTRGHERDHAAARVRGTLLRRRARATISAMVVSTVLMVASAVVTTVVA